jgi:hypothetical protein
MEGAPSITSATARFMAEVTESGWLSAGLVSSPCMNPAQRPPWASRWAVEERTQGCEQCKTPMLTLNCFD